MQQELIQIIKTASNVSLIFLFVLSFIIISSLLIVRLKNSDCKSCLLLNDTYRSPFGFLFVLFGLVIKLLVEILEFLLLHLRTFGNIDYEQISRTLSFLETVISPYVHTITETSIFIGFSIIFWPTIKILSYKLLGTDKSEKIYFWFSIFLILLFKFSLTILGIFIHYFLLFSI